MQAAISISGSRTVLNSIVYLLIVLWVYAAISKLIDFDQNRNAMLQQVFPVFIAEILAWAVPLTELAAASLLVASTTRVAGLYISFSLLLLFSIYILTVVIGYFGRVPCSCGGILEEMSWGQHLAFNILFIFLNFLALKFTIKERRAMEGAI